MASYTSAQSGAWSSASTWTPAGVPGDGDTVTIAGHTVTISDGTSVTVGDGVTADAIALTATSAKLVVNGNLTLKGNINLKGNGSELRIETVTTDITVTLYSTASVAPKLTATSPSGTSSKMTFTGTASHWVRITAQANGNTPGSIDGSLGQINNWQYTILDGLGNSSVVAVNLLRNLTCDRLLVKNCGQFYINATAATVVVDLNHFDLRNPANTGASMVFRYSHTGANAGTRKIRNSTFQGTRLNHIYVPATDVAFTGCYFYSLYVKHNAAGEGARNTYADCCWIGPNDDNNTDNQYMYLNRNAGNIFTGCGFFQYTTTTDPTHANTGHGFKEWTSDLGVGQNQWIDCVIDGAGTGGGAGNRNTGDFVLTQGPILMLRCLAFNGFGNLCDALYATAVQTVKNCTLVYASTGSNVGSIVLSEANGAPGKNLAIRNNLFVGAASGIAQGSSAPYYRQSAMELDYNCCFNLTSSLYLFNAAQNKRAYVQQPTFTIGTYTLQAGSTATKAVIPGNSLGVQVGDYLTPGYALITNVQENVNGANTTTLTTGINNAGGQGHGSTTGSVTAYYGYFAAGYYGDGVSGSHDLLNIDPQFVDPTRTGATFDAMNGGPGNYANLSTEMLKVNGWDVNGNAATYNPAYALSSLLSYLRDGYTARNPLLKSAGSPADGSPDIGALPVVPVTITGQVTVGGSPLADVTLTFAGGPTVTTNAGGIYSAYLNVGYTGTLTPSKAGYTFNPASVALTNQIANASYNFTADLPTYVITGGVADGSGAALPGVLIAFSTGPTVSTDASGNYTATVNAGYGGTLTPSLAGYTFSPVSRTVSNVQGNQTAQNFTATQITYTISGVITVNGAGLGNVSIAFSNGGPTVTTDANGSYTANLPYAYTGTATATLPGYTFVPGSHSFTNIQGNQTGQNFAANAVTYTISGLVRDSGSQALPGVTVSFANGPNVTTTASGTYTAVLQWGYSGTAVPSKAGYTFSPASRTYSSIAADQLNQDFTGTLQPVSTVVGWTMIGPFTAWDNE